VCNTPRFIFKKKSQTDALLKGSGVFFIQHVFKTDVLRRYATRITWHQVYTVNGAAFDKLYLVPKIVRVLP
jgi:hypothetical protein